MKLIIEKNLIDRRDYFLFMKNNPEYPLMGYFRNPHAHFNMTWTELAGKKEKKSKWLTEKEVVKIIRDNNISGYYDYQKKRKKLGLPSDYSGIYPNIDFKQLFQEMREKSKKRNFNQSIELIINLRGLDVKKSGNRIQERIE